VKKEIFNSRGACVKVEYFHFEIIYVTDYFALLKFEIPVLMTLLPV